ncbi:phosphatase RsbU N-terminal domain-containing protein, partial [Staphylococcus hominis]|nr:phosphatase RsbU N-terminal domain-containing protein [Staphylococcus hominis]
MEEFKKNYKQLIDESLVTKNKEQFLKKCDEFTEEVIKKDILPEDVVDLHKTYIASLNLKTSQILDTLDVLEEVVKGFGYSYRDYQNLVDKMQFHDKEIDLA